MQPFNPYDPVQMRFLEAIRTGEVGRAKNAANIGVGGIDLTNRPRNATGFPLWEGRRFPTGISHAAGIFQFQPRTWNWQTSFLRNLDFRNVFDQYRAAWHLACQVWRYKNKSNLQDVLAAGEFEKVEKAMQSTWTSATGNRASPGIAKLMKRMTADNVCPVVRG